MLATFSMAEVEAAFAGGVTPPGEAAAVRLDAYDIGWRTAEQPGPRGDLAVPPGATIKLVNAGAATHNFQVAELGIDVDLPVGRVVTARIPADSPPGVYEFNCNVPGYTPSGMVGTITIDPALLLPTPAPVPAGSVRLGAYDFGWRTVEPPGPEVELMVAPGTVVELVNAGASLHTFTVRDLGIDQDMLPGYRGR